MEKKDWGYADKVKELGTHASAVISLHLKSPDSLDKERLFDDLVKQYQELEIDPEEK